jgi:hypothetical protein
MFIGHYSISMAARAAKPRLPLWAFVAAAQALDILWCVFIMAGLERVEADTNVTEGLAFTFYPYSHSLAGALVWAALAWAIGRRVLRTDNRSAALLGAVVLSHWFLDLIVHRADLPLWPGGAQKLGLGMWNLPMVELALEILLFAAAGLLLLSVFRREARARWKLAAFLLFGILFMIAMRQMEPSPTIEPVTLGAMGLGLYFLFILLAFLAEGKASRTEQREA